MILPDGTTHAGRTPAHWRRVALILAKRTGHEVGLDTATRMAMEADLADVRRTDGPQASPRASGPDQLEELKRIISEG